MSAMPEMKEVPRPVYPLDEEAPSTREILTAIKKKSNGAAPESDVFLMFISVARPFSPF